MPFTVITDTSGNLPKCMADEYGLTVIPFYYHVDGEDLCCEAIENFESDRYYQRLKEKPPVTTTQITPQRYLEYFETEAKAGRDFIFVSMSSGISGSCDAARVAVRTLKEDYPDVKAFVVDTKGAALGEDPHRAALGQEGDLVAFLHAKGHEAGTDAVGLLAGLALGDFGPFSVYFFAEVGVVFVFARIFLYKIDNGQSVRHK